MTLQPGRMLSSYQLIAKLGEGGMGVVWRAMDTRLDREVALKVLPREMASDPERLGRFEREAKAVAALNHPNIVTLYSVEHADGERFLTMELVEGTTLGERISSDGLTLREFFDFALPLADALTTAHERGIIHRDLKPANIMIGKDGRLKVLDFGLAKLREPEISGDSADAPTRSASPLTRTGQFTGTAPYMSPEQLQGRPIDPRTDLFSMGIILYEMATGRRPFTGDSSADLISSILRDAPQPITDIKGDLPNHLGRIVRHCLEKDVDRRYQTAKDLRNELEDLKTEMLTGDIESSRAGRRVAAPRRSRIVLPSVVAGLVLVALIVGFALRQTGSPVRDGPASIAVLPFANLTGDAGQDYLAQGIGAALITRLGEIAGVQVVGRYAAWGEPGAGEDPQQLAQRLGVGTFLEGEVQQAADRLQVNVKLTDAASGLVLWSETFEGTKEDLFTLQKEMARKLTGVIEIPLSRKESNRLARNPTGSFQAYDYFLRGGQLLADDRDPRNRDASVEMFRQAIRADPQFALAHVALSEALWLSYRHDAASEKLVEAEQAAQTALEIDAELPAAQVALARIYRATGRYSRSIDELKRALENHPKPEEAQRELAASYQRVGDLGETEKCLRAAAAMGGEDWFNWNALGAFLEAMARYDEAREAFKTASDHAPEGVSAPHENLAALTIQEGRFDEAVEAYERLPGPIRQPALASNIGTAYYFSDRPDKWKKAEQYYKLAVRLNPRSPTLRRNLADLYVELGRADEALHNYREALVLVEEQLDDDPASHDLRLQRALYAAKADECTRAAPWALELEADLPLTARNVHKLAHVFALCGREDDALRAVRTAVELGVSVKILSQEREFEALRTNPEFTELIESPGG